MNCPHCKTELVEHLEESAKQGAQHCNGCGCCFEADGKTPRPGVPLCALAQAPVVATVTAEPEPAAEEEEVTSSRGSRGRGG
jgi:transcription initiation factor TFIIIB Brf1 subunit/transcription initiation factor TFIIB